MRDQLNPKLARLPPSQTVDSLRSIARRVLQLPVDYDGSGRLRVVVWDGDDSADATVWDASQINAFELTHEQDEARGTHVVAVDPSRCGRVERAAVMHAYDPSRYAAIATEEEEEEPAWEAPVLASARRSDAHSKGAKSKHAHGKRKQQPEERTRATRSDGKQADEETEKRGKAPRPADGTGRPEEQGASDVQTHAGSADAERTSFLLSFSYDCFGPGLGPPSQPVAVETEARTVAAAAAAALEARQGADAVAMATRSVAKEEKIKRAVDHEADMATSQVAELAAKAAQKAVAVLEATGASNARSAAALVEEASNASSKATAAALEAEAAADAAVQAARTAAEMAAEAETVMQQMADAAVNASHALEKATAESHANAANLAQRIAVTPSMPIDAPMPTTPARRARGAGRTFTPQPWVPLPPVAPATPRIKELAEPRYLGYPAPLEPDVGAVRAQSAPQPLAPLTCGRSPRLTLRGSPALLGGALIARSTSPDAFDHPTVLTTPQLSSRYRIPLFLPQTSRLGSAPSVRSPRSSRQARQSSAGGQLCEAVTRGDVGRLHALTARRVVPAGDVLGPSGSPPVTAEGWSKGVAQGASKAEADKIGKQDILNFATASFQQTPLEIAIKVASAPQSSRKGS